MGNLIKEELNKMKYLFGYQRGIVVSEQIEMTEDEPFEDEYSARYNWNGKQKGMMDFTSTVLATNVGFGKKRYRLGSITEIPRLVGSGKQEVVKTTPEPNKTPVLTSLNLSDSAFPYPDNMVQAKFESFPEAKEKYDAFIQNILDFLKSAHMNQMGTLTIQGTADAARPTYDIPKGYSKLDHPGTLYNGLKDPNEMNQYLADTRAQELGKRIVQDVLNKSGIDITKNIIYKKGINYYGQQGKRGFEFKSVNVTPSQTTVNIPKPDVVTQNGVATNTKTTTVTPAAPVEQFIDLRPYGGPLLPATRFPNGMIGVKFKDINDNKLFTGDGKGVIGYNINSYFNKKEAKGEIKGNQFFIDGILFGDFSTADVDNYDVNAESSTKFVTSKRPMITGERDGWQFISLLGFTLSSFE